jgi:hypothetical protein
LLRHSRGYTMTHTIKFSSVKALLLWLADNDINDLPVDLTIHLGDIE